MSISLTLFFTFIAIVGWGFGDFFIQKMVRKIGNWETLFLITAFGAIALSPFVIKDIPELFTFNSSTFFIMLGASVILLFAALFEFESLKQGKLAIVEPIWSLEIIASTILAFLILNEIINFKQVLLIGFLIIGLILISLKSYHFDKKIWLEKGVFIAVLAAITMGAANFFVGFGARASDGIMMIWFLNCFMALTCLIYLVYNKKIGIMFRQLKENKKPIIGMCILDNAAWLGFALAMAIAPIGITVALSESYIIIPVLLGIYINKEYIRFHQKFGIILAIISAIMLAIVTY